MRENAQKHIKKHAKTTKKRAKFAKNDPKSAFLAPESVI